MNIQKILKKYPITALIYITDSCCVYKTKQPDTDNCNIIKITPCLRKRHKLLKHISQLNNIHLLTPISVSRYGSFTLSVYPFKTTVISRIINDRFYFKDIFELATDLCDAVNYLHLNNILHLDISPNNIYINDDGTFCLGDFSASHKKNTSVDRHEIYYTEGYSPPEFKSYSENTVQITELSDEYSIGKTILSLCKDSCKKEVDDLSQRTDDIPKQFFNILNKAANELPEYRYPSINDFKAALMEFREEYDINAIKYYPEFNTQNNPFTQIKTSKLTKRNTNIESSLSITQKIINSPAFITVIILSAIILPLLTIYTIFFTPAKPHNISASNISAVLETPNTIYQTDTSSPEASKTAYELPINTCMSQKTFSSKELEFDNKKITSLSAKNIDELLDTQIAHDTITVISASDNILSDISGLSDFTSLKELYLSGNRIKNIEPLKHMYVLNTLVISSNMLEDITDLKNLKSLESLDLSGNRELKNIDAIRELKNLKLLCLNETAVSKKNIDTLKHSLPECKIIY